MHQRSELLNALCVDLRDRLIHIAVVFDLCASFRLRTFRLRKRNPAAIVMAYQHQQYMCVTHGIIKHDPNEIIRRRNDLALLQLHRDLEHRLHMTLALPTALARCNHNLRRVDAEQQGVFALKVLLRQQQDYK
jgi:hypothetical protein